MEKQKLLDNIQIGLSISDISKKENKSKTTIAYWLNKHGLKTKNISFKDKGLVDYGEFRFCPRCKNDVELDLFYDRRGKKHGSVYCKSCTSEQTIERQQLLKSKCVEYKGGKCICCGYNKCNSALEFHHLDEKEKDFNISDLKTSVFTTIISDELDKCVLVCANCHREIHSKIIKL